MENSPKANIYKKPSFTYRVAANNKKGAAKATPFRQHCNLAEF